MLWEHRLVNTTISTTTIQFTLLLRSQLQNAFQTIIAKSKTIPNSTTIPNNKNKCYTLNCCYCCNVVNNKSARQYTVVALRLSEKYTKIMHDNY